MATLLRADVSVGVCPTDNASPIEEPHAALTWGPTLPRTEVAIDNTGTDRGSVNGRAGSSQRRNTDGFLDASRASNSSAGVRSLRTSLGRLLSSFSTARRCCGVCGPDDAETG